MGDARVITNKLRMSFTVVVIPREQPTVARAARKVVIIEDGVLVVLHAMIIVVSAVEVGGKLCPAV